MRLVVARTEAARVGEKRAHSWRARAQAVPAVAAARRDLPFRSNRWRIFACPLAMPAFVLSPNAFLFSRPAPSHSLSTSRPLPEPSTPRRARLRVRLPPTCKADYYDLLSIPRDADAPAIKKAFRRAALKSHPDVSSAPDAKERFMAVQEAYATLSDPAKRRVYDRSGSASGFGFEDFAARASEAAGAAGFGGRGEDFARKWRERNPMPEDMEDNLGSIFGDLFSGISEAVGGAGVAGDFVEFLENQVGSYGDRGGYDSDGGDEGLEDVLRSGSSVVLEAEREDTDFLVEQLRARERKLGREVVRVESRAREWGERAGRGMKELDFYAKEEAAKRKVELDEEVTRLRKRCKKVRNHLGAQEKRLGRIEEALEKRKATEAGAKGRAGTSGERTGTSKGSSVTVGPPSKEQRRMEVDEELERLKREMGL